MQQGCMHTCARSAKPIYRGERNNFTINLGRIYLVLKGFPHDRHLSTIYRIGDKCLTAGGPSTERCARLSSSDRRRQQEYNPLSAGTPSGRTDFGIQSNSAHVRLLFRFSDWWDPQRSDIWDISCGQVTSVFHGKTPLSQGLIQFLTLENGQKNK